MKLTYMCKYIRAQVVDGKVYYCIKDIMPFFGYANGTTHVFTEYVSKVQQKQLKTPEIKNRFAWFTTLHGIRDFIFIKRLVSTKADKFIDWLEAREKEILS